MYLEFPVSTQLLSIEGNPEGMRSELWKIIQNKIWSCLLLHNIMLVDVNSM